MWEKRGIAVMRWFLHSDRKLRFRSIRKSSKLDYQIISQTSSTNLCIADEWWKMIHLKTDWCTVSAEGESQVENAQTQKCEG